MAHSLEQRVIRITEMLADAMVWKTRAATPGTPAMPEPMTSTRATPGRKVRPRAPFSAGAAPLCTRLPGWSGAKLLRTRTGIFFSRAGWMVLGCSTLAPKKESSMASS
jgi:hypothetical protein